MTTPLPFGLTKQHLALCNALAQQAAAKGNPPVGCLILQNGEIIAQAEEATKTKQDITCHAEIEALRQARQKLHTTDFSNCVLLTTHEPCVMCGYAIRFHRISQVVYASPVPYLGSISSSFNVLMTDQVPNHWASSPEIVLLKF